MRPLQYAEILYDHSVLRDALLQAPDSIFLGMTSADIADYKTELSNELILDASFKLITKIEADIRQDFIATIGSGWTDPLSLRYVRLLRRKARHPADPARIGVGPIVGEMRMHFHSVGDPFHSRCEDLALYLGFRNWYAHGRFSIRMPSVPIPAQVGSMGEDLFLKVISRTH